MSVAYVDEFPDYFGDVKRFKEQHAEPLPTFDDVRETDCPECGRHVHAHIIDGPDPVFIDLACPRDLCRHVWSERVV
ncbi:hypothetical protein [Microbacterium sp. NPDC057944]|uniref:hypothetical protein n=1 Tax=Microbacterium sp. NPDC057944 TaxID=3346286 RepID=UPI0036DB9C6B